MNVIENHGRNDQIQRRELGANQYITFSNNDALNTISETDESRSINIP